MARLSNLMTKYWPYLLLGVVAVFSHGLLLLNDGTYWDEWLLGSYLAEDDWKEVNAWATESGMPAIGYFYWALKLLGLIPYYKIIALATLFTTAVLVFKLCSEFNLFTRFEAVGVAVLSLTYPAYQTTIELSTFRYLVFYCAFLFVILQLWRSARAESPLLLKPWRRVLLLAILTISYNLNSLLVLYFPLLFVVFWQIKEANSLSWIDVAKAHLLGKLDFIALPFIFYAVKKIFTPAYGAYAGYNELNLDPASVWAHLERFAKNALYGQIDTSLTGLFAHPLVVIFLLPLTYLAYTKYQRATPEPSGDHTPIKVIPVYALLLFGVGLLLAGMFPYAAVGLSPAMSGWNTRHALLISLPVAFLMVSLLRPLWIDRPAGAQGGLDGRFIAAFLGGMLVVAFSLSTASYYVSWQARAVKDKAIMADLAEVALLKNFSVFWINDQYPLGGEVLYRFYEWAGMFKKTWGGESRVGFQVQGYNQAALAGYKSYYNKSNNLSEFDPSGCQAGLIIRQGALQYSEPQLVWKYFQYKFFEPQKMTDFLHGVVNIHIELPETESPRCPIRPYLDLKK